MRKVWLFFLLPLALFAQKKAIIFGITGQDGAYLAEFLLEKGYEVHGVKRRASFRNTQRVDHIYEEPQAKSRHFYLHYGDVTDALGIAKLVHQIEPDEIYNLAAQSHVRLSFEIPDYTNDVNAGGPLRILEAIHALGMEDKVRFYQASTSEMFGAASPPQNEQTLFYPRSPYAVSKLAGHWHTINYREAYGIFACSGILFNHESPRRGETFLSHKVTKAAARISKGLQEKLYIGNLNARRDWGYALDYVEAMWLMLQQNNPDDYVIATGESHSVREFCELAFSFVGIDLAWKGEGLDEVGYDRKTGRIIIEIDERYFRPTEVDFLRGDPSKAIKKLGWNPQKTSFKELVELMVRHNLEEIVDV
ncbi:MAG: GDP-mannose 4,6-dehydratase [Candidatus Algichlamydia australiensis]|nr:GDP-mannose 4,6-dehydratase [Chlamydiales bacterium]